MLLDGVVHLERLISDLLEFDSRRQHPWSHARRV